MTKFAVGLAALFLAAAGAPVSAQIVEAPGLASPPEEAYLNVPRAAHRTGIGRIVRTQREALPASAAPSRTVIVPPGQQVVLTPVYPIHYPKPIYITPPLNGNYVPPYYLPPAYYYAYPAGHVPITTTGGAAAASAQAGGDRTGEEIVRQETRTVTETTMLEENVDK